MLHGNGLGRTTFSGLEGTPGSNSSGTPWISDRGSSCPVVPIKAYHTFDWNGEHFPDDPDQLVVRPRHSARSSSAELGAASSDVVQGISLIMMNKN